MQCSETRENLSAYLDGELDPGEESALRSHLEGCESCRGELEALRATVELVRSLPRAQAPAVLKQRLAAAASARRPASRFHGPAALASAAALVLMAVVAIFMLTQGRPGETRDLAVGTDDEGVARPAAKRAPSSRPAGEAAGAEREGANETGKHSLSKYARRSNARGHGEVEEAVGPGRLAPEVPAEAPASEKAIERRAEQGEFENSDSEEGYKGLAEKTDAGEKPYGKAELNAVEGAIPPSQPQVTAKLADGVTRSEPGLPDAGKDTGSVKEIVIETRNPAEMAAKVNKILGPHVGRKSLVTGAALEELAKTGEEDERDKGDTVEMLVYIDRASSGEVLAQLQNLKKPEAAGWGGRALGDSAEKKEEKEPEDSADDLRRRAKESLGAEGGTAKPSGTGGARSQEEQRKQAQAPAKKNEAKKKRESKESTDKLAGSPEKSNKADDRQEEADEKADRPVERASERVAILIRIVRIRPAPADIDKALEEKVRPVPAAKGK